MSGYDADDRAVWNTAFAWGSAWGLEPHVARNRADKAVEEARIARPWRTDDNKTHAVYRDHGTGVPDWVRVGPIPGTVPDLRNTTQRVVRYTHREAEELAAFLRACTGGCFVAAPHPEK